MVKLSGILQYSMGGFLCLRGFASFKMLSAISEPNPEIQRDLIEEHKGEMARFLNQGEYRFFPEVIMSLSLTDGKSNFETLELFHYQLQSGKTWNRKLGDINFDSSQRFFKNQMNSFDPLPRIERMIISHITFDEAKHPVTRIDGNHRMSAAEDVKDDFLVPYCLLLFRNPKENEQFSRAIFHNINAKQIPLNLEENLKVILESVDVFTDTKLKEDPSFGWKYFMARIVSQKVDFVDYPFINSLIREQKYSFLVTLFESLLTNHIIQEKDSEIHSFISELPNIEKALEDAKLHSLPRNIAVIGALSYYKLSNNQKYNKFIQWIKQNSIAEAAELHISDLISVYDKVFENTPKSIFMSMWFSDKTEDTYQTVKDVQSILKRENDIDFQLIKVDEHPDGYSDDIYHRIVTGIHKSDLVIADLSYGNKNVHHEIGYAQALGKKVLLLYRIRDDVDSKTEIGSNISMYDQLRFKNQTELRPKLLKKIKDFYGITTED